MNTNQAWVELLRKILDFGDVSAPRGKRIKELLGHQTRIDMASPVVTVRARKLGRSFMPAEAAWIMSGDNRVATIENYAKHIASFSNDEVYFDGAYGPKIVDQLTYVVDKLCEDPDTRQAVLNIWRENPRDSKDVPCTISAQWLIRNGTIHCVDTMRSSDAWLGAPYDWYNFSMLTCYVVLLVRERCRSYWKRTKVANVLNPTWMMLNSLKLGNLIFNAGSQHLYETNWEAARAILNLSNFDDRGCGEWVYKPMDLDEFVSPGHFVEHHWMLANKADPSLFSAGWLKELL